MDSPEDVEVRGRGLRSAIGESCCCSEKGIARLSEVDGGLLEGLRGFPEPSDDGNVCCLVSLLDTATGAFNGLTRSFGVDD